MDIGLFQSFDPLGFQNLSLVEVFHGPHLALSPIWMAQEFKEDILSNISQAWDGFIRSGQVWALIIGFVMGYIFRSITSY